MNSVYATLQKLRDQKKREKYIQYAEAEQKRLQKEDEVREGYRRLQEERNHTPENMGMRVVQDYLRVGSPTTISKAWT